MFPAKCGVARNSLSLTHKHKQAAGFVSPAAPCSRRAAHLHVSYPLPQPPPRFPPSELERFAPSGEEQREIRGPVIKTTGVIPNYLPITPQPRCLRSVTAYRQPGGWGGDERWGFPPRHNKSWNPPKCRTC